MMKWLATILAAGLWASGADAADLVPWHILPGESSLGFTAHDAQNGSITGGFGKFTGAILFDPERLAESKISIDVDVTSVQAGLPDAATDLPKPEWLGVKAFPSAHYESKVLRKRADGLYEAEGSLELKGTTMPVTLTFALPGFTPKRAVAKGTARLSRGAFKIGDSDLVKDPVDLTFTVTAEHP